ncbi:MAG: tyrosine-protein phosphatase [Alphaproteobacteria bacterium]|nr:tyrosine-protein phosphatase [Alphaproteobacteria bacterium]
MHRLIALEGATNFRDLGGYEARDGRRVRWRRLFRADGLHRLTPGDGGALAALGLEEALDLRYGPERAGEPALLPAAVASVHIGLAAAPGASLLETMNLGGVSSAAVAKDWLTRSYAGYPEKYAPACGAILRRLVAEDAPPLLFHCTAGKDRTGFAAAVVLEALGVPRTTIMEDYLLTNRHWDRGGREPQGLPREIYEPVFSAREEYLAASWATLDKEHGGLEGWLDRAVGFGRDERARLSSAMLE